MSYKNSLITSFCDDTFLDSLKIKLGFNLNSLTSYVFCDASYDKGVFFQDPATPVMEGIIYFHNEIMIILMFIVLFVLSFILSIVYEFCYKRTSSNLGFQHHTIIEIVWTTLPTFILFIIAVPSFALLYAVDENVNATVSFKTIGHQWYWSYEYESPKTLKGNILKFDSYLVPNEFFNKHLDYLRNLETTWRVVVPYNIHVRLLASSADVLHSWAMPSLGVKIDCCPGRLNETTFFIKRRGVYYGQCSEICGVNHAFMPITLIARDIYFYIGWYSVKLFLQYVIDMDSKSLKNVY